MGVTSDLVCRMCQHRDGVYKGFSRTYNVKKLVYYEVHEDITEAIRREKQIKRWRRLWKIQLIEKSNPKWEDLFEKVVK